MRWWAFLLVALWGLPGASQQAVTDTELFAGYCLGALSQGITNLEAARAGPCSERPNPAACSAIQGALERERQSLEKVRRFLMVSFPTSRTQAAKDVIISAHAAGKSDKEKCRTGWLNNQNLTSCDAVERCYDTSRIPF